MCIKTYVLPHKDYEWRKVEQEFMPHLRSKENICLLNDLFDIIKIDII